MTRREEGGCHFQERLARQCAVLPKWAGCTVPRFGVGAGGVTGVRILLAW